MAKVTIIKIPVCMDWSNHVYIVNTITIMVTFTLNMTSFTIKMVLLAIIVLFLLIVKSSTNFFYQCVRRAPVMIAVEKWSKLGNAARMKSLTHRAKIP